MRNHAGRKCQGWWSLCRLYDSPAAAHFAANELMANGLPEDDNARHLAQGHRTSDGQRRRGGGDRRQDRPRRRRQGRPHKGRRARRRHRGDPRQASGAVRRSAGRLGYSGHWTGGRDGLAGRRRRRRGCRRRGRRHHRRPDQDGDRSQQGGNLRRSGAARRHADHHPEQGRGRNLFIGTSWARPPWMSMRWATPTRRKAGRVSIPPACPSTCAAPSRARAP